MRDVMICYDIITIMNILLTFFRANLLSGLKPATHFAALLIAVILLAACGDKKSTPAASVPAAPTPPTEVTIPYFGSIREATEFKFALSSEEEMYIYTSGSPDVELYNSDKVLIERSRSIRRTLSAGTYYLIAGRSGSTRSVYIQPVIRVSIPYTSSGQSLSNLGNDEDWFSFTLTSTQVVDIDTSGSTDTYGRLYDSAETLLEFDNDDGSGSNFGISRLLSAGTYYVQVVGRRSSTTGSYTLSIQPRTPVSFPNVFNGHQISPGDVDWFSFTLTSAQLVNIYTISVTDTYGELYNSAGTRIESDNDDGPGSNFRIYRSLSAGTYHVLVRGQFISTTGSYSLSIGQPPYTVGSLPYTSSGQSISPADNYDWFVFTLTSTRDVDIYTSGSTDTYGFIHDSAGRGLEFDDNDGSGSNFRISRRLSAGTYYVLISGRILSTTGTYTLRIE